ncbi:hypothetical protein [Microbacterium sp. UFMG61]|uniref:hypothetical protein n=1 Tax=Microbacterium sp. UFMG61 TaxID=2745935 RepID=UPI00189082D6|nr:hypothetical protein [Microbacterium sp. UFMG61]
MVSRGAVVVVPALVLFLVGCAPGAATAPTPTPAFASEAEAFAAAEEVYRAYNEAFSSIDLGDPGTFEAVFELATGDFQKADRTTLSELHAEGYSFVGSTTVVAFKPLDASPLLDTVTAVICVDVSMSDVTGADGRSVLPESRPDLNALRVRFIESSSGLLIDHADRVEESKCAG